MNARANANAAAGGGGSAGGTANSTSTDGSIPEDAQGGGFAAVLRFAQMIAGLSLLGFTMFGISKGTSGRGKIHAEEDEKWIDDQDTLT